MVEPEGEDVCGEMKFPDFVTRYALRVTLNETTKSRSHPFCQTL